MRARVGGDGGILKWEHETALLAIFIRTLQPSSLLAGSRAAPANRARVVESSAAKRLSMVWFCPSNSSASAMSAIGGKARVRQLTLGMGHALHGRMNHRPLAFSGFLARGVRELHASALSVVSATQLARSLDTASTVIVG
jgi:hypothetical protein